jgi:hypothetical protein
VRAPAFRALSANVDALLIEIDLRPKQALRFLAPERNDEQEPD